MEAMGLGEPGLDEREGAGNVGSVTLPRPTGEMGTVGGEAEGREADDKFPVTIGFDDGRLL